MVAEIHRVYPGMLNMNVIISREQGSRGSEQQYFKIGEQRHGTAIPSMYTLLLRILSRSLVSSTVHPSAALTVMRITSALIATASDLSTPATYIVKEKDSQNQ